MSDWIRRVALIALGTLAAVPASAMTFVPVAPCRIVDTRLAVGALAAGTTRSYLVRDPNPAGSHYGSQGGITTQGCGIPDIASPNRALSVAINIVAVAPDGPGDLRAWPSNQAAPNASVLNYTNTPGLNIANGIILPICDGDAGACSNDFSVRADVNGAHLVIDVSGYFTNEAPPGFFGKFGGDGHDGSHTVVGTEALPGFAAFQYTDLTIPVGTTLVADGFLFIAVQGTCTIAGTINADGANLNSRPANTFAAATGENGIAGNYQGEIIGVPPVFFVPGCTAGGGGGGGATGGDASFGGGAGGAGGSSGTPGLPLQDRQRFSLTGSLDPFHPLLPSANLNAALGCGGGGGGSGTLLTAGAGNSGGAGGAGGGVVYIECGTLDLPLSGLITAKGLPGGSGAGSAAAGGGGGGGGGVVILRVRRTLNLAGNVTVTGGVHGSGVNGGSNGGDGGDGFLSFSPLP